jgi:hypothetical protein
MRVLTLGLAITVPAAIAPAAGPAPTLKLLTATATGLCATPPNRTVVVSATITPVRSCHARTGAAWFAYGPSAAYDMGTVRNPVPWASGTGRAQSVTATITPRAGVTHYALLMTGPRGASTRTPDTILKPASAPCPFPGGRRVSVRWSLIEIDNADRRATIRYRLECGSSRTAVHVSKHPHGVVSVGVSTVVPEPAPECFVAPPPTTRTVKLPHTVSRAQLHHDAVTPG